VPATPTLAARGVRLASPRSFSRAIFFRTLAQPYDLGNDKVPCTATHTCLHPGLSWHYILAVPGFLLAAVNAAWVALFLAIVSTRFRDFPNSSTRSCNCCST
jgi:ABC-type polysaccharide/polyol phosphate export permease